MADSLSVAVMTRDEAQKLDRCLASIKGFVDEVVVLDTGSKDDSIEVAKSHGARVESIVWPDSFSEGLNALLALVKTDWTLRMDSDEWFEPEQAARIKGLIADDAIAAYRLVIRDLMPSGGHADLILMRLWRTHESARYQKHIHETIPDASMREAFPGKRVASSDVWFWHDGHIDMTEKTPRNRRLLERQIAENPDDLQSEAMLIISMRHLGEPVGEERMLKMIDRMSGIELASKPPPQVAMLFCMYFENLSEEDALGDRAGKAARTASRWFSEAPVVVFFAARLMVARKEFARAFDLLLNLEQMASSGRYDRTIPVPKEMLGPPLWNMLGYVATQVGREDVADRCRRRLSGPSR